MKSGYGIFSKMSSETKPLLDKDDEFDEFEFNYTYKNGGVSKNFKIKNMINKFMKLFKRKQKYELLPQEDSFYENQYHIELKTIEHNSKASFDESSKLIMIDNIKNNDNEIIEKDEIICYKSGITNTFYDSNNIKLTSFSISFDSCPSNFLIIFNNLFNNIFNNNNNNNYILHYILNFNYNISYNKYNYNINKYIYFKHNIINILNIYNNNNNYLNIYNNNNNNNNNYIKNYIKNNTYNNNNKYLYTYNNKYNNINNNYKYIKNYINNTYNNNKYINTMNNNYNNIYITNKYLIFINNIHIKINKSIKWIYLDFIYIFYKKSNHISNNYDLYYKIKMIYELYKKLLYNYDNNYKKY